MEIDDEIAKVFGPDGIVVFRETQQHGLTPDFQQTEEAMRNWLDEEEEEEEGEGEPRAQQLKALHEKLLVYADGMYKFLKTVWDDVNYTDSGKGSSGKRVAPLCKPTFVVICLGYDNLLRKGCLLYCLHRIRAPSWMKISLVFILLADLLRMMHAFVCEVKKALHLSATSYDFITPEEEKDEPPKYWWGSTEIQSVDFGYRDVRSSLLYPKGTMGIPDQDLHVDDSVCSVM